MGNYGGNQNSNKFNGQKRKNRIFTPVTVKMITEASPGPDDVCEIDGEHINDVSTSSNKNTFLDYSLSITILVDNHLRKNNF